MTFGSFHLIFGGAPKRGRKRNGKIRQGKGPGKGRGLVGGGMMVSITFLPVVVLLGFAKLDRPKNIKKTMFSLRKG